MRRLLLVLLGLTFLCGQLLAQNRTITGKVTDEKGNPLSNATVLIKGTTKGTATDNNGSFTLNAAAKAVIVVSSVGFHPQEFTVGTASTYDVSLTTGDQSMNELIVVAYGTAKKGEITSSSVQLNYDKFKNRPVTNISSVLEGASTGIIAVAANGQPGSSQSVRVRGFGSINAGNDPIYVVDGVVYSGGLSNFNMDDVESVSVLKDAASTALYGSRGANGVIIITTKRGKKNRNQISFKTTQGYSTRALPEYDRVTANQYYPLMWQAYVNNLVYGTSAIPLANARKLASGLYPRFTSGTNNGKQNYNGTAYSDISQLLGYNPFNVTSTTIVDTFGVLNPNAQLMWENDLDWNKDLERMGSRREYSVNYSGGNEKTDFFSSFGYVSDKGFILKSDQNKFTGRLNVNSQPLTWFRTGINLAGTVTTSNQAADGSSTGYVNPFFFTRMMGPIYPLYAHSPNSGAYMLNSEGNRFYDYGNLSAMGIPNRPAGASPGRHVVEETKLNQNSYKRNIVSGRAFGDVLFTKDLKFTTNISLDLTNYYGSTYDNNIIGDGAPAGRASKTTQVVRSYTFNQLLNYGKKISAHNFSVLAGHENYDLYIDNFSASRQGQIVANNYELDNFTTTNGVSSSVDKARIESWLSRVNYDFDGKYFLSASVRRDGNSRFKKEFRWDNFWSIGGAWRLDKEAFMNIAWVDQLKLRASYGRVGNDALSSYYPYQALYSLGYNNALEPGIRQQSLRNDSISWEGQKSADLAVEFGLFKNRISGTIEYYSRKSDDIIFPVQLPLSFGGYSLDKNIGEMVNKGVEIQLGGDLVRKRDFNWHMDLNWSKLKNEITKMPDSQPEIISGTKKLAVGHSVYDYWLRDWKGVDPNDGAALYAAASYVASNSRIRGKDDTVTISQNNARYVYAGSAIPDFWGSVGNTFSYKGFELNVLMTYQVGGKIYDATYAALMHTGTYGTALSVDALKAWQKPGDVTDVPRMDNSKGGVFDAQSSRWLIDASFLSLRSASLGYNLPTGFMSKIHASNGRVFVSGENLQWFSKRKGMNVQQSFSGVTSNTYVPARTITVGLNVNF